MEQGYYCVNGNSKKRKMLLLNTTAPRSISVDGNGRPIQRAGSVSGVPFDIQPRVKVVDGNTPEERLAVLGNVSITVLLFQNAGYDAELKHLFPFP